MNPIIDLISILHHKKESIRKNIKQINVVLYSFIFTFIIAINFLYAFPVEAGFVQNDKLIARISKDYTNKFCNSIAFGLSKESAMNFANKENNMIFKKKRGIDKINKDSVSKSIAALVVEDCGYLIGLKGEKGIMQFEKEYGTMNNY